MSKVSVFDMTGNQVSDMEISDTVISQCSNFLIFKMTHPKDIKYVEEMLPNMVYIKIGNNNINYEQIAELFNDLVKEINEKNNISLDKSNKMNTLIHF